MKDFIRIGGPIISSPLNENFRILANAVSLANTNLIFSKEDGVKDTVEEMLNIHLPEDGQACYVIATGAWYRYSKAGNGEWVRIADLGKTARLGFLNSGVVLMEGAISKSANRELSITGAVLYFRDMSTDSTGIYTAPATVINLPSNLTAGTYSIYAYLYDNNVFYTYEVGLPIEDDMDRIFMGSFLIDGNHNIIDNFVYTIPDMAYTADRGSFYVYGGEIDGCNLRGYSGAQVSRDPGYYYDEGINCPYGNISTDYPNNIDSSNCNIKHFDGAYPSNNLYYMVPSNLALTQTITSTSSLIKDKYYDKNTNTLKTVASGHFTIQQHFITPNGQNIILYGTEVYNSMEDALSHLNDTFSSDLDFPKAEVTRIIIGNIGNFDSTNTSMVQFYTLSRIAQVGTISPKFSDADFELYSSDAGDTTPATLHITLKELQDEDYNSVYKLAPLPYNKTQQLFSLSSKYITDSESEAVTQTRSGTRTYNNTGGYLIADKADLDDLISRVSDIEYEIWNTASSSVAPYRHSIRQRLYAHEVDLGDIHTDLNSKIENISIARIAGNSGNPGSITNLGNVTGLTFYNDGTNISVNNGIATIECVGQWNPDLFLMKSQYAIRSVSEPSQYAGFVDKAIDAQNILALNNASANQYYGTDIDGFKGVFDLPKYVATDTVETHINIDDIAFAPVEHSVALEHLANGRVTYLPSSEETQLGTNVYDLVKYHYHKVYNSGTQGPYISGTTTQDTSAITYEYEVPYGNLMAHDYYFTYNNISYIFNLTTTIFAGMKLVYTPSLNTLYYTDGNDNVPVTITQIPGSDVDIDYLLPFTSKTDWNKINEWNFGNNLTVSVVDGRATINASVAGSGATNFVNLDDTEVTYNDANIGKMIVLGKDGSNNYKLMFGDATSLSGYMLISDYADTTSVQKKVKYATRADTATNALTADIATTSTNALNAQEATYALDARTAATADLLQNTYSVNDNETSYTVLWSASQIVDYVDNHIPAGGVHTYCGTSIPSSSLGNDGDIYIMIDGGGNVELTPEEIININDSLGENYNIISDMTEEEATNMVNDIVFDGGQASI